jgi:VanZ family protein
MAAIFYLSAQPFTGPELAWWEVALRKLGHLGGYAALAALWAWALAPWLRPRAAIALAVALAVAYAVTDEWHQTFVDGRHGSPLDVGIDALGAAIAGGISLRRAGRRRSDPSLVGRHQHGLSPVEGP